MKIEKIERSKHKQERVLVYLEGGDLLRITESELLRFGLYVGLDISPETVVQLQKSGARSETRVRAANMISARPLSKKELTRRLVQKGAEADDAGAAAEYLEEIGALDDAAYAAMLVRHYSAQGCGPARIRDELYRRGVPRELWDEALAQLPPAADAMRKVVVARLRGRPMTQEDSRKLAAALQRRGFSWNDIRPVLNEWGQEIDAVSYTHLTLPTKLEV